MLLSLARTQIIRREITYSSRGVSVPASVVMPALHPSPPVVLIAHGHHGTRNERFGLSVLADALARRGIASIRMDFAGCGESSEPFTVNSLTTMKADMLAAAQYAESEMSASAVGLFGYSMGGRVVLELLAEGFAADAAAMLAPAADTQDLIETAFPHFDAEYAAIRSGLPALPGSEERGLLWFADLLRYTDPAAAAANAWNGPSLVLYGQDDAVVRAHVCEAVAEKLNADVFDASGKGHGYGCFRGDDELLIRICEAAADFFVRHLNE